jgi:hypothetical protein
MLKTFCIDITINRFYLCPVFALLLCTNCTNITQVSKKEYLTKSHRGYYVVTTVDGHAYHVKSITPVDTILVLDHPSGSSYRMAKYPLKININQIKSVESIRSRGPDSALVLGILLIGAYAILLLTTAGGIQPD